MRNGDLSAVGKTAFAVALARAGEASREHPWFVDPLAVRLAAAVPQATKDRISGGLTAWVTVRTRFLDELLFGAIERGIRQVVIVGAGLDARAFRLRLPDGFAIFEMDREDVFAAKRRILTAANLVSTARHEVVADVLKPGWLDAIEYSGWRRDAPTLWILEGFLIYFDAEIRMSILTQLADSSAAGSELGATMSTRTDEPRNPLWKPFDGTNLQERFVQCGWSAQVTSLAEASGRFGRPLPEGVAERLSGVLVTARTPAAFTADDDRSVDPIG